MTHIAPEHILDRVAEIAASYMANKTDRLLKGIDPKHTAYILNNATARYAGLPVRRALHQKILQNRVEHLADERPDNGTVLYVTGPMAAGKTTLLNEFLKRANASDPENAASFSDANLEAIFQTYASMQGNMVVSDFQFYK